MDLGLTRIFLLFGIKNIKKISGSRRGALTLRHRRTPWGVSIYKKGRESPRSQSFIRPTFLSRYFYWRKGCSLSAWGPLRVGLILGCVRGGGVRTEFRRGSVAVWQCGCVAVCSCGHVVMWSCGHVAVWSCGHVAMWPSGYVAVRNVTFARANVK